MIREGRTDIMQSAPSTNWAKMEKRRNGFPPALRPDQSPRRILSGRPRQASLIYLEGSGRPDPDGPTHGSQPLAMLRYAVHYNGVDWSKIDVVNADVAAFREGKGDFIHLQAPAPQQLEEEGIGWNAVSVGASMPPNAFQFALRVAGIHRERRLPRLRQGLRRSQGVGQRDISRRNRAKEASYFTGYQPGCADLCHRGLQEPRGMGGRDRNPAGFIRAVVECIRADRRNQAEATVRRRLRDP